MRRRVRKIKIGSGNGQKLIKIRRITLQIRNGRTEKIIWKEIEWQLTIKRR